MPHSKGFVLTSNRDEKLFRETIAPRKYLHGKTTLCYPKDALAGGSWIAMSNKGRVVCLLNGAFIPHVKQSFHTHSRGKVLIEAASSKLNPDELFSAESLQNTEPFTLLTLDFNAEKIISFSELIWDGKDKHFRALDTSLAYIWSSVTLYTEANRKERKDWFRKFLKESKMNPLPAELIRFHSGKHTSDNTVNVVMEREDGIKTVSITQIIQEGNSLKMNYSDLIKQKEASIEL